MLPKLKKTITFSAAATAFAGALTLTGAPAAACGSGQAIIGTLCLFAAKFEFRGYLLADGRLVAIKDYQSLYSLIGTTYGGDGVTNFALPDLRGRTPIGFGNGFPLGQTGGQAQTTLNVEQLPAHTHQADVTTTATEALANTNLANSAIWARDLRNDYYYNGTPPSSVTMSKQAVTASISNTGGGKPIGTMPPYVAMTWLIAYEGIYPTVSE